MGTNADWNATLQDGVPAWLRRDLSNWLSSLFGSRNEGAISLVRAFDQRARLADPLSHYFEDYGFDYFERVLYDGDEAVYISFLDFLVWRLTRGNTEAGAAKLAELEELLRRCSSAWTVGTRDGFPGLERRVPEGVQLAADAAMATPGHAGTLLSEAWHAAYGVSPNPEVAYSKAVLAVEAAAVPVVSASNPGATLGTVFAQMRDQGNWGLDIVKQHPEYPTNKVLLGMIQALWKGHGRHAGQPDWAPNTQVEAEAAVMLAVPLVQWFSSGAVARRP